jgi:hypothetical protein
MGNETNQRKPDAVPFCGPQIQCDLHDIICNQTQVVTVRSQCLNGRAMTTHPHPYNNMREILRHCPLAEYKVMFQRLVLFQSAVRKEGKVLYLAPINTDRRPW